MAITNTEQQVLWSTANSLSVSGGSTGTSDAITVDQTAIDGAITLKAGHSGTPGAGDTVDFFWLGSCGDPDGASTDEYATTSQGVFLAQLDTNADDPAITTVPLPSVSVEGYKIYAVNNAGESVTVSACSTEKRSA